MSKNKSILKSIRMTDEVFHYIDSYRGDGFNQRFENIILDAMLSEAQRKAEVNRLDGLIRDRKDRFQAITDKLNHLDSIYKDITRLVVFMSDLSDKLDEF